MAAYLSLTTTDVDAILDLTKRLAQAEFSAGRASASNHMLRLDFHVTQAQAIYADIEALLGREPGPPLEF